MPRSFVAAIRRHRILWGAGVALTIALALLIRFAVFPAGSSAQPAAVRNAIGRAADTSAIAMGDLTPAVSGLSSLDSLLQALSAPHPSLANTGDLRTTAEDAASLAARATGELVPFPAAGLAANQLHLSATERQEEQQAVDAAIPELRILASALSAAQSQASTLQSAETGQQYRAAVLDRYVLAASTPIPAPIADIEAVVPRLRGPTLELIGEIDRIASENLLLAAASAQIAVDSTLTLINQIMPLARDLADAIGTLLRWEAELPSTVLANATTVGAGWAAGTCPNGDDPIVCWLLQGTNGQFVSDQLAVPLAMDSFGSLVCLIAAAFTGGAAAPPAVALDSEAISAGVLQLGVDTLRHGPYIDASGQESLDTKVWTIAVDAVGILLTAIDLGSVSSGARILDGVAGEADTEEKAVEAGSSLLHLVDETGATNIKLVQAAGDIISLIGNAESALRAGHIKQATTDARQITTDIQSIGDSYSGPLASQIHAATALIVQILDRLFHLQPAAPTPAAQPSREPVVACQYKSEYGTGAPPNPAPNPVPTAAPPPGGVAIPAGSTLYGSGLSRSGLAVNYIIGPKGFACSASALTDGDFDITLDYQPQGLGAETVTYLFQIAGTSPLESTDCYTSWLFPASRPASSGCGELPANLKLQRIPVDGGVYDVLVLNAGLNRVLAPNDVIIGTPDGKSVQYAGCDLPANENAICQSALDLFVLESEAFAPSVAAVLPSASTAARGVEAAIAASVNGRAG